MEKRTPNDADDAGPFGQYHQHHWGPVSPFARCLADFAHWASMRQVWHASPRPNPMKCACCMFLPILPAFLWFLSLSNA